MAFLITVHFYIHLLMLKYGLGIPGIISASVLNSPTVAAA